MAGRVSAPEDKNAERKITALLLADHRRCQTWCRDRVGVPMDKFPHVVLQAKDTGHTQSQRSRSIAPTNLSMPSLHFDDTGKPIGHVFRYKVHAGDVAIAIVRCGTSNCLFDLFAAACIGPKRVTQSYVVTI